MSTSSLSTSIGPSLPDSIYRFQVGHWIHVPFERVDTYLFWRAQFLNVLKIHHLQNVVDGSQGAPTEKNVDGSINLEFTTWKEKNCEKTLPCFL